MTDRERTFRHASSKVMLGHLYVEYTGMMVDEYSATLPDGWCAIEESEGFFDIEQIDESFVWRTETEDRMEEIVVANPDMPRKEAFLQAVVEMRIA